mgnify:CR=1 FL=1
MREGYQPRFIFVRRVVATLISAALFSFINVFAHITLEADIGDDILYSKYRIEVIDENRISSPTTPRVSRSTLTPYSTKLGPSKSDWPKKVSLAQLRRYGWVSLLTLASAFFVGILFYRYLNGSPGMRTMRLVYRDQEDDPTGWRKAVLLSGTDTMLTLGISSHWLILILFGARFHHLWVFIGYATIGLWFLAFVLSRPAQGFSGSQSRFDRSAKIVMTDSFRRSSTQKDTP